MKNRILLTAIALMFGFCASAQMFVQEERQMSNGMQNMQTMQPIQGMQPGQLGTAETMFGGVTDATNIMFNGDMGIDPIANFDHGGEGDEPGNVAPIGSGAAILVAMGAAYAALRRRKERE